jgi:hypothetical protein
LNTRRNQPAGARRSPDKALRQASMTLAILEGTLQDVNSRLEAAKRWMSMIGRPGLVNAIDELGYVSEELSGTRQKIGEARIGYRRLRPSRRRTSKAGRKN